MKKRSNLIQSEGGQILIFVIIIMMLAVIIIPAILGLTYSSAQTTNIRMERMQVLYAADTGIEDALYTLDNLGNGTSDKVPITIYDPPRTYYLPGSTNGSSVTVTIDKVGAEADEAYIITSTAFDEQLERKVTIQVHVTVAPKQIPVGPIYQPGEGNVSTSPFEYALAVLGSTPPDFTTSGQHPPVISGDVYANSAINFPAGTVVQGDGSHSGNVWAEGTVTLASGTSISGSVHSGGNIILQGTASIGISAYADGSIQNTGTASWIQESAGAYGAINVQNGAGVGHSIIGNSSVAGGDIHVSGPLSGWGFNVGGDVASNHNITVDNNGKVIGNAAAGGTVTTNSGGNISGTRTQYEPQFTLTLPEIPTLVPGNVSYWQNLYKAEAQTGTIINGDYNPPNNPKDVYLGNTYITGKLDLSNGNILHLGNNTTVYVEGQVWIRTNANIIGSGKLVSVGNMNLQNSLLGDPSSMPLLMTLGCFNLQNWGTLAAVLYSPYCQVDLRNWNNITGSVVAQRIIAGQETAFTWDPSVRDIPGLPGGTVTEGNGTWIPVEQPPIIEYTGVHIDYYRVCDDESCS